MNRLDVAPKAALNTRVGKPGDQLGLAPEQIGVFDPSFTLEHVTLFRLAGRWAAHDRLRDLQYEWAQPVKGFSACGLTGYTSAVFPPVYRRWIPVLEAFNGARGIREKHLLRGAALSIMQIGRASCRERV